MRWWRRPLGSRLSSRSMSSAVARPLKPPASVSRSGLTINTGGVISIDHS
jgi:hypothetical protein